MAKASHSMSTQHMLVVFLLVIGVIALGALYFDLAKENRELTKQVEELKASQVLLMVPDEQAADIANWLAKYPDQTKALAARAADGEGITMTFGPGSDAVSSQPAANTNAEQQFSNSVISNGVVTENAQGVKVITLPHGGIRVTTREVEPSNSNNKQ
ncbi:membrane anchored protein in chemotaxis locus [Shewanella sp. ENK2]|uniref:membrane anchored protein in chemotaxis locus n=1 Tax=Shewanella sp. ENK2 TaxID=2775245 RepID=UPI00374A72BE